jgi:aminoglycoside phosphotransferase (APT) family kinase protein
VAVYRGRVPPATPHPDAAPLPGLDLAAVLSWLDDAAPGLLAGPVSAQLVAGGRSNLTYLLTAGGPGGLSADGMDGVVRVVLRRPPLGHVLATAHDMGREARAMRALAGSAVPVPTVHAWCQDPAVTGAPFYVMSYVDGLVVRGRRDLAGLDGGDRSRLAQAMVEVLADLHGLDVDAIGLGDWARPGYLSRQLRRWSAQLDASRGRELAGIDELRRQLESGLPSSGPSAVVHGDYRLDNLVLDRSTRAVLAVLDWEMSTVGDPLADLGLLTAYWDGLGSMTGTGFDVIGPASGFPDGAQLARWYAARHSTHVSADELFARLPWYVAFGYFKIAVIFEGIHYRHVTGGTVGEGFGALGPLVPAMVDLGLAAVPQP